MTKEEKVLWATWMASTDIKAYAVDIFLDFTQMMNCELSRIWDEGIHITTPSGLDCVVYPDKKRSGEMKVMILTPDEGTLIRVTWSETEKLDELIVKELKRVGFTAPWVSGMEVKNILVAKWGKNWCDSDNISPETLLDKFDLKPDDLKFFDTKEGLEQYCKSQYPQRKIVWD